MSAAFDPYAEWLQIRPEEQPPDHYRLLGLTRFESRPEQIRSAADERMALVRRYQTGPKAMQSQELLNALAAARMCLLNADTKSSYDAVLQGQDAARMPTMGSPAHLPDGSGPIAAHPSSPTPVRVQSESRHQTNGTPISVVSSSDEEEADEPLPVGLLAVVIGMSALLVGMAVAGAILWTRWQAEPSTTVGGTGNGETKPKVDADPYGNLAAPLDTPVLVYPEAGGEINLSAASALLSGDLNLITRDGENAISDWTTDEAGASWQCLIQEGGIHRIDVTYAITADAAATEFTFECGKDRHVHSLSNRAGPGVFVTDEFFLVIRRSGEQIVRVHTDTPTVQGTFELRSIRITPR